MTAHVLRRRFALASMTATIAATIAVAVPATADDALPEITRLLESSLAPGGPVASPLEGVAFLVQRGDAVVYRQAFGDQELDDVLPLASASKWLSGAVIAAALDRGEMALSQTIGTWLPTWTVPDKSVITVRQAFSHTSGLPGRSLTQFSPDLTLRQAADSMAGLPLNFVPGAMFGYGGVSMHVAAAASEVATGLDWATQFAGRVTGPLGMTDTGFTEFGAPSNPMPGGGASATIDDYAAFLRCIAAEGRGPDGTIVLSPPAVRAMLASQSGSPPIFSTPLPGVSDYGIGVWREEVEPVSGTPIVVSSPGAFGTTPWIDFERGYSAVLLVDDSFQNVRPLVDALRVALDAAFAPVCPADRNGDRRVAFRDVLEVLAGWGVLGAPWAGGDASGDGQTGFEDLLAVLAAWGPCTPAAE
jgi:CubicO group peptidase (beta-lactamase class C family)